MPYPHEKSSDPVGSRQARRDYEADIDYVNVDADAEAIRNGTPTTRNALTQPIEVK